MRRAVFLLIVVFILIIIALMMGLGWYAYIPEKISEVVVQKQAPTMAQNVPQKPAEQPKTGEITEAEQVRLNLKERAGYKKPGYAEITVKLVNLDNFAGSARLNVTLYYAKQPVASTVALVENIQPLETTMRTITVSTTKDWNAFDVRQV
jgi:uncharacterized iron-regulated membrane protein